MSLEFYVIIGQVMTLAMISLNGSTVVRDRDASNHRRYTMAEGCVACFAITMMWPAMLLLMVAQLLRDLARRGR